MRRRLLVADDSSTIQKVIKIAFARFAVDIVEAVTLLEALAALAHNPPDAFIVDASLPGTKGPADFVKLRGQAKGPPVLLLVGTYEAVDEAAFRAAGFQHVLKKPFESADIVVAVEQLLGVALEPAKVNEDTATGLAAAGAHQPGAAVVLDRAPKRPAATTVIQAGFHDSLHSAVNLDAAAPQTAAASPASPAPVAAKSPAPAPTSRTQVHSAPVTASKPEAAAAAPRGAVDPASVSVGGSSAFLAGAPDRARHATVVHSGGLPGLGELDLGPLPGAAAPPPPPASSEARRGRRAFANDTATNAGAPLPPPAAGGTSHVIPPAPGTNPFNMPAHAGAFQAGGRTSPFNAPGGYTNPFQAPGVPQMPPPTLSQRAPSSPPAALSDFDTDEEPPAGDAPNTRMRNVPRSAPPPPPRAKTAGERDPAASPELTLAALLRDAPGDLGDLPALVRQAVEAYCERHFKSLAREIIAAELRRLADEKARHLVDN